MKYEKIWSNRILSIEFLENDTIKFFTDTLGESYSYNIVFEKSHDFKKSNLVDVNSVFDEILTPLSLDDEKFLMDFEVKEINDKWLQVKNYKTKQKDFFWVTREDAKIYSIKSWSDYLIGRSDIKPIDGNWTNVIKRSPSSNSKSVPVSTIDCIAIYDVVDEYWLEVRFDNYCSSFDIRYKAYIKWRDSNQNILIKL